MEEKCQLTEKGIACENKAKFEVGVSFSIYRMCEEHTMRALKEGKMVKGQILGEIK